MLLNKNKILMLAVVGVIANLSSDAKSQTFYQCMPKKCPIGQALASDGNCKSTNSLNNWTRLYTYSEGQGEAKLDAGTYRVNLRGGFIYNQEPGCLRDYVFTVDKPWTFKFGVGQPGSCIDTDDWTDNCGGSGGSWISIDDQYIVAGGSAGKSSNILYGGVGGAVGAGSSSYMPSLSSINYETALGGSSGNYTSSKLQKKPDGKGYISCISGEGATATSGGTCVIKPTGNGYNYTVEAVPGTTAGLKLYPGWVTTNVGGGPGQTATTTHKKYDDYNCNRSYHDFFPSGSYVILEKFI